MTVYTYISNIFKEYCKDYPKQDCTPSEQLWAIETTIDGINSANKDCHNFIEFILNKTNSSYEDMLKKYEEIK